MEGKEIFEKITSIPFHRKAKQFEEQHNLLADSFEEALEFLTLYLTLLVSSEYTDYDEEHLKSDYEKIKCTLEEKRCIELKDFMSSPIENRNYVLTKEGCCSNK